MVLGTMLGWSNGVTVAVSILLAFATGYALTLRPLLGSGMAAGTALRLAFAADTLSIALMEVVDNLLMLVIPGAMAAPLSSALFWGSLVLSLVVAGLAAWPLNAWLIARGRGHAVVHDTHGGHENHGTRGGHHPHDHGGS